MMHIKPRTKKTWFKIASAIASKVSLIHPHTYTAGRQMFFWEDDPRNTTQSDNLGALLRVYMTVLWKIHRTLSPHSRH